MNAIVVAGIAASPGIAIGPVFHYSSGAVAVTRRQVADSAGEWNRLEAALAEAGRDLEALAARTRQEAGAEEAAIFEAHALFLQDPGLLDRARETLDNEHVNVEYAWHEASQYYAAMLRSLGDELFAARANDMQDVEQRVLRILSGAPPAATDPGQPSIIVAADLTPSDTVSIEKGKVLAFCTAEGGPTAHVAILSKALGIPAVVGLGAGLAAVLNAQTAILDGGSGKVMLDPDAATVADYTQRAQEQATARQSALAVAAQPALTADGVPVEVVANVGRRDDVAVALEQGAEGIGLLRTEFLFLDRETAPDEEEQYATYRAMLDPWERRPVVVRTLDIGGDKPAPYLDTPAEMNPFLGVRGLRLSLAHPEVFQTQLRALLRAGAGRNLKIMYPMVSSLEEIAAARVHVDKVRAELDAQGIDYARDAEFGIMVEVPAAAVLAGVLAQAVDFFSIGTNDLSQYTLAADRTNAGVAALADAFHPAVLRLIGMVIEAAHKQGRWVGLCGELGGEPLAVPVLLGLGLDEFSAGPRQVPLVKQTIRRFTTADAQAIAAHALTLANAAQVREYLASVAKTSDQ